MALSLKLMRERGYLVDITEQWIPRANIRKDLWSFCDALCVHRETGELVAVQTTTSSNMAARIAKIAGLESVPIVRRAGVRILVHGWRKKDGRWIVREVDMSGDLPVTVCEAA